MKQATVNTFQMKIPDDLNRKIKADAAENGLSKHEWILNAIIKMLSESDRAV